MDIRVFNLSAYWLLRTLKNILIKKKEINIFKRITNFAV